MYLESIDICPVRDNSSLFILCNALMHCKEGKKGEERGTIGRNVKTEVFLRVKTT